MGDRAEEGRDQRRVLWTPEGPQPHPAQKGSRARFGAEEGLTCLSTQLRSFPPESHRPVCLNGQDTKCRLPPDSF